MDKLVNQNLIVRIGWDLLVATVLHLLVESCGEISLERSEICLSQGYDVCVVLLLIGMDQYVFKVKSMIIQ